MKIKKQHKKTAKNLLLRLFPVITWLPKYQLSLFLFYFIFIVVFSTILPLFLSSRLSDLRYDIIAGITVGLTLVPQALAYAQINLVGPQVYNLFFLFLLNHFKIQKKKTF